MTAFNQPISRRTLQLGLAAAAMLAPPAEAEDAPALAKRLLAAVPAHGERSLGDPKAPVTMVEYASATCPHCAEFHLNIWPEIKRTYVDTGKVYFVFREMPIDRLALGAFMLARCVPQDKYFPTLDLMFRKQKTWVTGNPRQELFRIVAMAGLDAPTAEACIKNQDLANAITATGRTGNREFGVKGTPTFFVNGTRVDGHDDIRQVSDAIEAAWKKAAAQP